MFARQTIRLDGRYEFTDVPAAPGDAIPVEVAVYEFGDNGTPLRVDQTYSQASNLQLPAGAQAHYLGAGSNGFLIDDKRIGNGSAGFYQFRRGLSERFTGDLIIQSVDGRTQSVIGVGKAVCRRQTQQTLIEILQPARQARAHGRERRR